MVISGEISQVLPTTKLKRGRGSHKVYARLQVQSKQQKSSEETCKSPSLKTVVRRDQAEKESSPKTTLN